MKRFVRIRDRLAVPDSEALTAAGVLKEGYGIAGLMMRDSQQQQVADNGQAEYERRISNAWKNRPGQVDPAHKPTVGDNQQPEITGSGQAEYERRISNAWKERPRG